MSFWTKFAPKNVSRLKQKKWTPPLNSAYLNYSMHQISAETDNFDFWTKFAQKGCFLSKTEKVKTNTTIAFCIFKLDWLPNFSLNWQFWFLDQICTKRKFPVENGKMALVRASMVVNYYVKLFRTEAERHKGILMSLLLLVVETITCKKILWYMRGSACRWFIFKKTKIF